MQAAFLRIKLKYLEKWNERRNEIATKYIENITNKEIILPEEIYEGKQVWHIFSCRCNKRDDFRDYLASNGIGTGCHYPISLNNQQAYKEWSNQKYPIAEEISATQISLPMYYGLKDNEVDYIIEKINDFR